MFRRQRHFASLLAAFAILFAQMAVAAHWCNGVKAPAPAETAQVMAHPMPCHEGNAPAPEQNDNLCQAHCQYGSFSVDTGSATPPAVDVAGPVLFQLVPVSEPSASLRRAERYAPAAAPPPPAILFGVLRI